MKKQYIVPDVELIHVKQKYAILTTSNIEEPEPEVTENIGANEFMFFPTDENEENDVNLFD